MVVTVLLKYWAMYRAVNPSWSENIRVTTENVNSELYVNWNDNSYDKAFDSLKPK